MEDTLIIEDQTLARDLQNETDTSVTSIVPNNNQVVNESISALFTEIDNFVASTPRNVQESSINPLLPSSKPGNSTENLPDPISYFPTGQNIAHREDDRTNKPIKTLEERAQERDRLN